MPYAAGACATAVIDGEIYVAGGQFSSTTFDRVAVYNPATDEWREVASMPFAKNHAAGGTDGQNLYVFGGRGAGSLDVTQVYFPSNNTWQVWSDVPLPMGRGGMGNARKCLLASYCFRRTHL